VPCVTAPPTPTTVQSLGRGLRLLRLFTRERPALTLADCAGLLELSPPSTYRLLNTLEAERFLERDPSTGAYRLAVGVLELLPALLDGLGLPRLAQPAIAGLARATGETAHLAVLEGGRVLYLLSESSDRLLRIDTAPGLQLDAHCTALGKCLLAQLSDERARAILGQEPYRASTSRTFTSWDAIERELRTIRRRGYALSEGELEEGLSSCAVALPSPGGPPHAINLSAPSTRMSRRSVRESFVPLLEQAASEIADLAGLLEFDGGRRAL
jgi:IclR family transcriptional regulator, pca regulon regulatory protein